VQVAATTPQTARVLFAISPNVANLLAVVALGQGILSFVGLTFDSDVAEGRQLEYFLRICRPGLCDEK
jgi:hypothetical protein